MENSVTLKPKLGHRSYTYREIPRLHTDGTISFRINGVPHRMELLKAIEAKPSLAYIENMRSDYFTVNRVQKALFALGRYDRRHHNGCRSANGKYLDGYYS